MRKSKKTLRSYSLIGGISEIDNLKQQIVTIFDQIPLDLNDNIGFNDRKLNDYFFEGTHTLKKKKIWLRGYWKYPGIRTDLDPNRLDKYVKNVFRTLLQERLEKITDLTDLTKLEEIKTKIEEIKTNGGIKVFVPLKGLHYGAHALMGIYNLARHFGTFLGSLNYFVPRAQDNILSGWRCTGNKIGPFECPSKLRSFIDEQQGNLYSSPSIFRLNYNFLHKICVKTQPTLSEFKKNLDESYSQNIEESAKEEIKDRHANIKESSPITDGRCINNEEQICMKVLVEEPYLTNTNLLTEQEFKTRLLEIDSEELKQKLYSYYNLFGTEFQTNTKELEELEELEELKKLKSILKENGLITERTIYYKYILQNDELIEIDIDGNPVPVSQSQPPLSVDV